MVLAVARVGTDDAVGGREAVPKVGGLVVPAEGGVAALEPGAEPVATVSVPLAVWLEPLVSFRTVAAREDGEVPGESAEARPDAARSRPTEVPAGSPR